MLVISSVKEVMSVEQSLNPPEKDVIDKLENLDDIITSPIAPGDALFSDGDVVKKGLSKITTEETLERLHKLRLYEERQPEGHLLFLSRLMEYEQVLLQRLKQEKRQSDIRSFFS